MSFIFYVRQSEVHLGKDGNGKYQATYIVSLTIYRILNMYHMTTYYP